LVEVEVKHPFYPEHRRVESHYSEGIKGFMRYLQERAEGSVEDHCNFGILAFLTLLYLAPWLPSFLKSTGHILFKIVLPKYSRPKKAYRL
jgi:hypothetical protein